MNLSLGGKHAIVCGASQGIGRACALALAELGACVTVVARNAQALAAVVASLSKRDGQAHELIALDFADPKRVGRAIRARVDSAPAQILVNNTGGPPEGPAHSATSEEYLAAFTRHLLCNQALVQAVLPGMKAAGYGRVINIISVSVKEPIPGLGVSNTVRGAVASWAKTLARELGPDNITVNNVLPGFTNTSRLHALIASKTKRTGVSEEEVMAQMRAQVPLGRFAEPQETANVVAFLASPAASYVNGINLPVDGGRTLSL
ncbi:MAG: SDR family oxidoreductase [Gammaproteobacteria bacterium]